MDKYESVGLAILARKFWQLVANSSGELVNSNNTLVYICEEKKPISTEKYRDHTKWSDISIVEPLLFNFYHGIELSLKALLTVKGIQIQKHDLSALFNRVNQEYNDCRVTDFYTKYISKEDLHPILLRFCSKSNISMDFFYQSLKYPSSTKGKSFKHGELQYNGKEGVELFKSIKYDVEKFIGVLDSLVNKELNNA